MPADRPSIARLLTRFLLRHINRSRVANALRGSSAVRLVQKPLPLVCSAQASALRETTPRSTGPIWEGFAKRYGMRLTGISTGNAMEVGLGTFWGEDPRYFRDADASFRDRLRRVVVMTFVAHNRKGNRMPAYARYISTPGNNFLSNTWRADSDATNRAAAVRTLWGFAGLMGKNAFAEFCPAFSSASFTRSNKPLLLPKWYLLSCSKNPRNFELLTK